MIKGGFAPNHLVFRRNPDIPNLTRELTPVSTETGGEEDYLRTTLEGMRIAREIHVMIG